MFHGYAGFLFLTRHLGLMKLPQQEVMENEYKTFLLVNEKVK